MGLSEQLFVGHTAPQKIRESRRQLVFSEQSVFGRRLGLDQKQELRRYENRRQRHLNRPLEALAPLIAQPENLQQSLELVVANGPAKSPLGEMRDDLPGPFDPR